jgi:transcriptional regulator of acetoin/glycerol metabolism
VNARSGHPAADRVLRGKICCQPEQAHRFDSDEVMAVLKAHAWPGNLRELQNFIERAVLFSPGSVLRLPLDLKPTVKQSRESAARTLAEADRGHILETLNQTNWMIGWQDGAANRLGLPRTTLISKMRKLGIETRRSLGVLPIRQLPDEQCHASANC